MKQRMFWTALFFMVLATGMLVREARAQKETELIEPDSQAVEVINGLLGALSLEDDQARWYSLLSVLHPVMLVKDGTEVHPNFKRILGRKVRIIETYLQPAEIEKVERVRIVSGNKHRFGALETDVVDRYYLKQTTNASGFVVIVWTEEGVPKVVSFV